jgi:hypothetical protein
LGPTVFVALALRTCDPLHSVPIKNDVIRKLNQLAMTRLPNCPGNFRVEIAGGIGNNVVAYCAPDFEVHQPSCPEQDKTSEVLTPSLKVLESRIREDAVA